MVSWDGAADVLEFLAQPLPTKYDESLKPEDLSWIKHHLSLANMNSHTDIVEFSKVFMKDLTISDKPAAPAYEELEDEFLEDDDLEDSCARYLREEILSKCVEATHEDYAAWLSKYRNRGGKVTHFLAWSMPANSYYVLKEAIDYLPELYGANSLNLIIPSGVTIKEIPTTFHGVSGHNSLFFSDGSKLSLSVESFKN